MQQNRPTMAFTSNS